MPQGTGGIQGPFQIIEFDVVGLLGDTVKSAGGTVDITAIAPSKPATATQDVTIVYAGSTYLNPPIVTTGVFNLLGIGPVNNLIFIGLILHANLNGRGVLSFPTTALPVQTIPIQGLTVIGGSITNIHWTSTAAVEVVQ